MDSTSGSSPQRAAGPKGPEASVRELLAEPDLRRLLIAQFLGQGADGIAQAVFFNVLVLEPLTADTPGRVLQLFALTLLPYSVVAPVMGVFVDRWSRRALLVGTNVVRAAALVSLPIWSPALPGDVGMYAAVLLLLALGRLFLATKGAVLPYVLHERHLLRGNSISAGGGMISALMGGVAGVGMVTALGVSLSFVVAGGLYAGASVWAARLGNAMRHPRNEAISDALSRTVRDLLDGVRGITTRAAARLALVSIFLLRTGVMFTVIAAILVIKREFPDAGDRLGRLTWIELALGTAVLGAFAGAVTAPAIGRRFNNAQLILVGFVVSGASIALLGGIQAIAAVMALTALGGYGGFIAKVAADAQVQEALPDELRGRAFALYDILYNLASVVAAAIMVTFQTLPLRPVLAMSGFATLAAAWPLGVAMAGAGLFKK